jgi:hypothetical protein
MLAGNNPILKKYYFYRYKPQEVRKPRIFTADEKVDDCPTCRIGHTLQKLPLPPINSPDRTTFEAQLQICKNHWEIIQNQRKQFQQQKSQLKKDELLIVQVNIYITLNLILGFH